MWFPPELRPTREPQSAREQSTESTGIPERRTTTRKTTVAPPLIQKIASVGRDARRLALGHGISRCVATVLAASTLAMLGDYLFRFQDSGVRWLCLGLVAAAAAWSVHKYLLPAIGFRPTDIEVARRIEREFPRLQERLSSGIAFLTQGEMAAEAGSVSLRRAVVTQASSDLEQIDPRACLDRQALRGPLAAVAALVLLGALLVALDTRSARLALARLFTPWGGAAWPRRNELALEVRVARVAIGQDFEAVIVDRNSRLPDQVEIQYWFDGEPASEIRRESMRRLNQRMVHQLANVRRGFRVRAVGGDDSNMAWTKIEAVEPPRLAELSLRLVPPAYTGWPIETAGPIARAIAGTRAEIVATATSPLASIRLRQEGHPDPVDVSLELDEPGTRATLAADSEHPWVLEQSGIFWLELTGRDGLSSRCDSWETRVTSDQPPGVSLQSPSSLLAVTRDAVVRIDAIVKDDLAVRSVQLLHTSSTTSGEPPSRVELHRGPEAVGDATGRTGRMPIPTVVASEAGETVTVHHDWDLRELAALQPGMWVDFSLEATDYKPQTGQSSVRRLAIISGDQLEERLAQRRAGILEKLAEAMRAQQDARSQTKAIEIQVRENPRMDPPVVDHLQSAELNQRLVQQHWSKDGEGLLPRIHELLAELAGNRLTRPESTGQLTGLLATLEELQRNELAAISFELVGVLNTARSGVQASSADVAAPPELADGLADAGRLQDQVIERLEELLGGFSRWDNYRRFSREIGRIRAQQQELHARTEETRPRTLSRTAEELAPDQRVGLKQLAEHQGDLARQFDRVVARMRQMQEELSGNDRVSSATLGQALELAEDRAIGRTMRDAGSSIESNRLGVATRGQTEVASHLDRMLDVLANRRQNEAEQARQQLAAASGELSELQRRQETLADRLADPMAIAADVADAAEEQQKLAEQARTLGPKLERAGAPNAAESVRQAAQQMEQAAASATGENTRQASKHAGAAKQRLDEATRSLANERSLADQQQEAQRLAILARVFDELIQRQQATNAATIELDMSRGDSAEMSREQLTRLASTASDQLRISQDAGGAGESFAGEPAFAFVLDQAIREMLQAVATLDRGDTGADTQRPQAIALGRLQQLRASLESEPGDANQQDDSDESGRDDGSDPKPPKDAAQRLAQLKLLKWMQEEINERTLELERAARQGDWEDSQRALLEELAERQGRLSELIEELGQ